MRFIRVGSALGILMTLGLMIAPGLAVSAGKDAEPAAVLAVAAGNVSVVRGAQTLSGSFGAALQPGDVVETGADAKAAVLFESGQMIELGPGSRITIGSIPGKDDEGSLMAQVPDALSGNLGRFAQTSGDGGLSALPTLRGGTADDKPVPLAPRNSLIRPGVAPEFRWKPVEDAMDYTVILTGPGAAAGRHRASDASWTPEAGFEAGESWTWSVEALTSDGPVTSGPVTFEVASAETDAEVGDLAKRLDPLMNGGDPIRNDAAQYLMGSYCRSTGFYTDAIVRLEGLAERHPDRKELQRELGSLYQAVGLNDKAADAYRRALKD